MTVLKDDQKEAQQQAAYTIQDELSFHEDIKLTFGTAHGRRVLKDIADETFLYDSIYTGNAKIHYNSGKQDFIKDILDLVAIADPETYQWFMMQRANALRSQLDDKIKALRPEE